MQKLNQSIKSLRPFLILWSTQALSALGSAMTSFALIIWAYQQHGSALITALLSVCSYAPYVVLSIFAGAVSDRWNKKRTMLLCDTLAAVVTLTVFLLLKMERLEIWHLYGMNALNGFMNAVQQPASEVAVSMLTPESQYQRVSGLRSFSHSLITMLTPLIATAVLAFGGIEAVILFDLVSFAAAFVALLFFIQLPENLTGKDAGREGLFAGAKVGIRFLHQNQGILSLILFLAAINFIASIYEAALPPMLLSRVGGGETVLGLVNASAGIANIIGSIAVSMMPAPKRRVRVICNALLFSMCTENFFLALGKSAPVWCVGAFLGWIAIPMMSANMDVLLRTNIPLELQGRVYSVRNALQFFTIPIGYLLGGFLVDAVFEPFAQGQMQNDVFTAVFGAGKGTGAALLYFFLAFSGIFVCIVFRRNRNLRQLDELR